MPRLPVRALLVVAAVCACLYWFDTRIYRPYRENQRIRSMYGGAKDACLPATCMYAMGDTYSAVRENECVSVRRSPTCLYSDATDGDNAELQFHTFWAGGGDGDEPVLTRRQLDMLASLMLAHQHRLRTTQITLWVPNEDVARSLVTSTLAAADGTTVRPWATFLLRSMPMLTVRAFDVDKLFTGNAMPLGQRIKAVAKQLLSNIRSMDGDTVALASLSDFVRVAVLHIFGGIYVDMDMLVLRDFAPLVRPGIAPFVYRWSTTDQMNTAVMALLPHDDKHNDFINGIDFSTQMLTCGLDIIESSAAGGKGTKDPQIDDMIKSIDRQRLRRMQGVPLSRAFDPRVLTLCLQHRFSSLSLNQQATSPPLKMLASTLFDPLWNVFDGMPLAAQTDAAILPAHCRTTALALNTFEDVYTLDLRPYVAGNKPVDLACLAPGAFAFHTHGNVDGPVLPGSFAERVEQVFADVFVRASLRN